MSIYKAIYQFVPNQDSSDITYIPLKENDLVIPIDVDSGWIYGINLFNENEQIQGHFPEDYVDKTFSKSLISLNVKEHILSTCKSLLQKIDQNLDNNLYNILQSTIQNLQIPNRPRASTKRTAPKVPSINQSNSVKNTPNKFNSFPKTSNSCNNSPKINSLSRNAKLVPTLPNRDYSTGDYKNGIRRKAPSTPKSDLNTTKIVTPIMKRMSISSNTATPKGNIKSVLEDYDQNINYENITTSMVNSISNLTKSNSKIAITALKQVFTILQNEDLKSTNSILPLNEEKLTNLISCLNKSEQHVNKIFVSRLNQQFVKIVEEYESFQDRNWSAHQNDGEFLDGVFETTLKYLNEFEEDIVEGGINNSCEILEILPDFYKCENSIISTKIKIGQILQNFLNLNFLPTFDQTLLYQETLPLETIRSLLFYFQQAESSTSKLNDVDKIKNVFRRDLKIETNLAKIDALLLTRLLLSNNIVKFKHNRKLIKKFGNNIENVNYLDLFPTETNLPVDVANAINNIFIEQILTFVEKYHTSEVLEELVEILSNLVYSINFHKNDNVVKYVGKYQGKLGGFSERTMMKINKICDENITSTINHLPLKLLIDLFKSKNCEKFLSAPDISILLKLIETSIIDLDVNSITRKMFIQLLTNGLNSNIITKKMFHGKNSVVNEPNWTQLKLSLASSQDASLGSCELVNAIDLAKF